MSLAGVVYFVPCNFRAGDFSGRDGLQEMACFMVAEDGIEPPTRGFSIRPAGRKTA